MLSSSDPAISHALFNVRYQVPLWLYHQRIDSKDYDEVVALILALCCANGLPLKHSNLIEPQFRTYFNEHGFFNLVFTSQIKPKDIPVVTPETLKELRFLDEIASSKLGHKSDLEAKKEDGRTLLQNADKDSPCFLKSVLIPFAGTSKDRPQAVFCINACLTNVANIWSLLYFDTEGGAPA